MLSKKEKQQLEETKDKNERLGRILDTMEAPFYWCNPWAVRQVQKELDNI